MSSTSASTLHPELPIAGIIPFSATDWPGKLTVTAFTQGCPLACPYCHNPQLQPVGPGESISEALELLDSRRGLIDALVISGGEPTMHRGLGPAIGQVHECGFPVGLHTCGYAPARISALLECAAWRPDWVGLDVKGLPETMTAELGSSPAAAQGCWESLALLSAAGVQLQVRTTVWPGSVLESDIAELRDRVAKYKHDLVVQYARGVDQEGRFSS